MRANLIILALFSPLFFSASAPGVGFSRVVSLNPDFTENILFLGGGERLVGVTRFCPATPRARVVGDLREVDLEAVVALRPDLVLISRTGNLRTTAESLTAAGLEVRAMERPRSLEGYLDFLLEIGVLVGREGEAAAAAARARDELADLRARARCSRQVPVFIQLDPGPALYTAADGTMIGDMIAVAGGINIAAKFGRRYPALSEEEVIAAAPEVIVICLMGERGEEVRRRWLEFQGIPAVDSGRVHLLEADLACRLGPGLLRGTRTLAAWLHPEWEAVPGGPR